MRPAANSRGGMYSFTEDMEMKAKLSTLAKRLEEIEMQNHHEVRAVTKTSMSNQLTSFVSPLNTKESTAQLFLQ